MDHHASLNTNIVSMVYCPTCVCEKRSSGFKQQKKIDHHKGYSLGDESTDDIFSSEHNDK